MSEPRPTFMDPEKAASVLQRAFRDETRARTIADAAAESGLALRDAERGLHHLVEAYDGHLRVTEKGALLFVFPKGFVQRREDTLAVRAMRQTGRALGAVARFAVRAWLTVAILAYVGVFVAVLLGLAAARQGGGNDRDRGGGGIGEVGAVLFRVLGDAFFWTFHPFSPLNVYGSPSLGAYGAYDPGYGNGRYRRARPQKPPFYERVNRFVFGPPPPPDDPRLVQQRILEEIRAQKGRVGLADVMRVTGLPRDDVDHRMARLMLDFDGEVLVSDEGGITYRFRELRQTAGLRAVEDPSNLGAARGAREARATWAPRKELAPLTGNDAESNGLIALLNGFNLVMGLYALGSGLTLGRFGWLLGTIGQRVPHGLPPAPGLAIVLGLVPVLFSLWIFLLPLGRAVLRPRRAREVSAENGRLALVREVLTGIQRKVPLTQDTLQRAWSAGAGRTPSDAELTDSIRSLGGDVDLDATEKDANGATRYRFVDLETEASALEEERREAEAGEADAGPVVFRSDG